MSRYQISWDEYDTIMKKIIEELKSSNKKYNKIFTFPRGGYIPAVHIANHLNILDIIINPLEIDENTLIVEDISDSGETLNCVYESNRDIVCICFKKGTLIKPSFFSIEFDDDEWIIFPWEPFDSEERRDRN